MHRQISALVLIFVMSIGAYAQPNEVQDILVTGVSSFGQANDIWQSFTPTQDGRLVKFTFDAGGNSPAGNRTISIFEGEGTGGTLLQTFTYNFVGNTSVVSVTAEVDLPTPIQVTQGSQYTWAVTNINPRTLINTNPNTYTGGTGFATFNGTPFTNFDIGFSIVLDIGTNVSIAARDEVSTTDPFIFDVTFYGSPTNLESSDFNVTNGTVSGLSMVSTEVYELSVSTTSDGTVTVDFPTGSALVDGLDNDAATADAEVDLPPFQNPDLILTSTRIVNLSTQLYLNNPGINSTVFIAPEGTTDFTPSAFVTQGTNTPDIMSPAAPGEYKLFLTDGAGNVEAVSSNSIFTTFLTHATTAAITLDNENVVTGETAEVTFAFLGAVTGFANDDLTIPNGTLSAVSSSDGNITFTATYTPNTDVVAASNVITLDNTGITDGATAGTGTTDSESFAVDTGIPKVSSVLCTSGCDDVYTSAGSNRLVEIDINFDRDVTLAGSLSLELDFVVANKSAVVTQNSARSFTATLNLQQSDLTTALDYASTSALTLATASSITGDSNGEAADLTLAAPGAVGSISENRTIYIDLIPPQIVTILRQDPAEETVSGNEVTFRVTFTEDIEPTSFGSSDFVLNGTAAGVGTVGTAQMISSTVFDYTVTGLGNNSGTLGLSYNGALTDLVTNNALSAAAPGTDEQYTLINTIASFESTPSGTSVSQGDDFEYNIEVSSNLNGTAYDISITDLPDWLALITNDTINTIAGTGSSGTSGNGGDALSAKFGPFLRDVTYDGDGNLYIVDRNNHMIRKVGMDNVVSQFAGTGTMGFSGDGSSAASATFNFPSSIAFDDAGNAYIADEFNYRVRKVDVSGTITTVAGNGTQGFSGDGGAATSAMINRPLSLAVGPDGNLYIAEELRIRKVDLSTGDISTVAGNGTGTFVSGVTGTNSGFSINAIDIDLLGSIYIASPEHNVWKIDGVTGLTSTIAGTGTDGFSGDGGAATSAQLDNPNAIVVDGDGNVIIAERENDRIRVIDKGGMIRTLAGNGVLGFSGDGGPATAAAILNPEGLAIDEDGRVVFTDAGNLRVRAIETNKARLTGIADQSAVGAHEITLTATNGDESVDQTFTLTVNNINDAPTLSTQLNATTVGTEDESFEYVTYGSDIDGDIVELSVTDMPDWMNSETTIEAFTFTSGAGVTDLTFSNHFFYLTSQDDNAIFRVDNLGGSLTQIAGQADNSAGFTDGNGTAAAFETPFAIDVDSNGDLYVIDQDNHALRKITDVDGTVTVSTIAGNGSAGDATGAASSGTATFDTPTNVLVAPNDDVYIADAGNGVVKKLSGGMITTLQDGAGTDFTFTQPYGLAIDNSGVLYVTDFGGHAVYSIDGTTRTLLAGTSGSIGSSDGDGAVALFDEPSGIVANGDGSILFVAESGNEDIRRIDIDGATVTVSTHGDTPNTPIGMIRNPLNGALLIADLGFNAITENYPAISVSGTPSNDDVGRNTVEFTLNDGTADFTEEVNFFIVNANDAPSITSPAPVSTTEDFEFSYTIEAEDIDGDALGFEATTLPDWLTFEMSEFLVSTVAGDGSFTVSGDGGAATDAGISAPEHLTVDPEGNIYIAHGNYIRKVDKDGIITTVVGDGTSANTGDSGPGVDAQVSGITDIYAGPEGNLFISVLGAIRKLDINGNITSIAGSAGTFGTSGGDGGAATAATFNINSGVFVDEDGNVFVADQGDNTVRKISATDNTISTVATGVTSPFDIVVDKDGNIYAVNDGSTGLLKIDENDVKTDLTGSSPIHFSTQDIAIDNLGNIYGTTSLSPAHQLKVYNINTNEVSIIANENNTAGFSGDGGIASDATFNTITAVATGPDGSVLLSDMSNGRIRKLTAQAPKVTGTPTQDELGDHNIVLEVSDGTLSATQSYTLTVNNLPEIVNVTSTDGFYNEGDVIDILVTFDGDITSDGSGSAPSFELETGESDQSAIQSANSGSTITFSYTVADGDNSTDLAYNSTAIDIGDYTIESPEGVNALLTLPASGASGSLSDNQEIVVDTESPALSSVSITSDNVTTSLAREGDEITLSIISSEELEADPTVTIAGNAATVTDLSSTTFEATYTMTADDEEGEIAFTVNFTDAAGNDGIEVTTTTDDSSVTYDTTSPSVVISSEESEATNAASFEITITFSSEVTGFELSDLSFDNAATSDFSGTGDTYMVTITPLTEGSVTIDIPADIATDASGNSNFASNTFEITYDTSSPTVALSSTSTDVNSAFDLTITFSESVDGFEEADLSVTNGTTNNFSGSGTTFTATITPAEEGEVVVTIASAVASDAAGNANSAATALTVNFDATNPTTVVSAGVSATNAAFDVTVTFSESVTDFDETDLAVTNGATSDFTGSGTTYTATVTPAAEGDVLIDVASSVASDAAGNGNENATQLTVTYDTTSPDVAITSSAGTVVNGPFDISVTFSESVEGFDAADLTLVNGTSGDVSGSGTTYTVTITPQEEGELSINITADVASDAAGNGNTAATVFTIENDVTEPIPAISASVSEITNAPFDITITFEETVMGFEETDLTLSNATSGNFEGSGTTYTATVTPTEDGTVTVGIAEQSATDAAGNQSEQSNTFSIIYDATSPSVELSSENASVTGAFDINISFSESVTGLELSDIAVENGTASDLTGSGSSYSVTVTPVDAGTVMTSIGASAVVDAALNANTASNSLSVEFDGTPDTTAPSVTLSTSSASVSGAFDVTIAFSESVTGLELSDLTVENGTASDLTGSGSSYSVTVTPAEAGTVTISIGASAVVDAAGNANTASNSLTVEFDGTPDTTAPTVTLSTSNASVSGAFEVAIAFSESVTGFELSDITVVNGTAAGLTGSGSNYSVTISPTAVGTVTVSIAAGVAADAAGNTNTASNNLSVEFDGSADTTAPTATISTNSINVIGEFDIEIIFNEGVVGFEAADITVDNGTLSEFAGSGSDYSATVTPTATGTVTISIGEGVVQDAAGNGNEAATLAVEATVEEVALSVGLNSDQVNIYPNPTTEFIFMDMSLPIENYQVFDLNGRVVLSANEGHRKIDVSQLKRGTYLLTIGTKEGNLSKTFIKK